MQISKYLARSENFAKNRSQQIKFIVVHFTANDGDTAIGNCKYFSREIAKASAHYFVDENSIWQSVNDKDTAYHVGAKKYYNEVRNSNSIGIEMCSRKDPGGKYYIEEKVIDNAVNLTKELMQKYNIPVDNVYRHYDVTRKLCPEPFVKNESLWKEFKERISDDDMTEAQVKKLIVNAQPKRYKYVPDLPEYLRKEATELYKEGIITGKGDPLGLDITEDMLRTLIFVKRMLK